MAKRATPEPFRYRGRWRAQVTLANGQRPHMDFDRKDEAADWIREHLQNRNTEHEPELGGPKSATLAQALHRYAHLYSVTKGGCDSELSVVSSLIGSTNLPSGHLPSPDDLQQAAGDFGHRDRQVDGMRPQRTPGLPRLAPDPGPMPRLAPWR